MSKVFEWSITAGSNNDAPPDGAPENMLPGKVNDVIRENMAAVAAWYADQTATLTTAGTTLAYTLATNSGYDALSDIPLLAFRLHAANTGACTLNVDGLGAKPLRKSGALTDYASADLTSGQTLVAAYNAGTDDFEVIGPAIDVTIPAAFPSGTAMLFAQTAAPTGWTKSLTHDNKALRLVTGTASSGGTTAFTDVFTSRIIETENLPSHTHGPGTLSGDTNSVSQRSTSSTTTVAAGGGAAANDSNVGHSHTVDVNAGVTGATGDDEPMDFAVQYVDVIMATKD